MEMPRPRLATRKSNKDTRPAVRAGLEKKTRRTQAQMQQARADEITAEAQAKLDRAKAKRRLAATEDKLRREDIVYAETGNHPPERPPKKTTPASMAVEHAVDSGDGDDPNPKSAGGAGRADDLDSGDDSEQYALSPSEENSGDSEPDDSDEDETTKKKKKKKPAVTRADIVTSRQTRDASGTPALPAKRKASKEKDAEKAPKKKAKVTAKKSGLRVSKSAAPSAPSADEHVERPKVGKKKKGLPAASLISIQPAPPKAPTRREVRGGTAKWDLKHLPPGTSEQFTDEVVPLARELVGRLRPWAKLSVPQVQGIVDRVFGKDEHIVTADGPWMGLVGYRLYDWRNGIAAQPHKVMNDFIELYETSDEEDAEETTCSNDDVDADGGGAIQPAADSTTTTDPGAPTAPESKPLKSKFNTPEGVAAFVEWCLQPHDESGTKAFHRKIWGDDIDKKGFLQSYLILHAFSYHLAESGTKAFHWKIWGDGIDKKERESFGFLQSYLILHAFSYHLACLEAIPGGYDRDEASHAERELEFWRTGEYVNPNKTANYFSVENYADTVELVQTAQGKKKKVVRHATKFLSTIQQWDDSHWKEVIEAAKEFMELPGRKRAQTVSRSGSEAGDDDAILSDDDVIMILSD
ncbi:hypothetical protein B0H13DRAFT_2305260 [Mycena leptocephala]|nr:hypothetical protein B0H13DRAFT_2305260 [Mycena leptocephala]